MDREWAVRPAKDECAGFYRNYIDRVPDGDVRTTLALGLEQTLRVLWKVASEQEDFSYGDGKWSVKEVVGHLVDAERVFAYRALRFGRGDRTPLTGFDENEYVRQGAFALRSLADLVTELEHLRRANLLLFRGFETEALQRRGVASGHPITVRALVWVIAGHGLHHLDVLRDKYRIA